jgi:predicted N-acetyltransferase YhbS
MADLRIVPLEAAMFEAAATMLGRAFVDNPIHVAAFGPGELEKNVAFFRVAMRAFRGSKLVAIDAASDVAGVIHWVRTPGCRFGTMDKLRMLPPLLQALGSRSAARAGTWLGAWAEQHPREPHSHLGPIGVAPERQGQGVGSRLMEAYCSDADTHGDAGYLETDRPENVKFYAKFGFTVRREAMVLELPNWFMWREPRARDSEETT